MQRVLMYFCVIIFACAESVFSAQDISMYPQLKGISLDDVFKGFAFCESEPSVDSNFYKLREFPLKGLNDLKNVVDFPLSLSFTYEKKLDNKGFYLDSLSVERRKNPSQCGVDIGYNENKDVVYYSDSGYDGVGSNLFLTIQCVNDKLFKSMHVKNSQGIREILFDDAGNVKNDCFLKPADEDLFKQIQNDIQNSVDKMAADVKRSPRYHPVTRNDKPQYVIHIPKRTGGVDAFDTLDRAAAYYRAVCDGKLLPLLDEKLFAANASCVYIDIREYCGVVRFVSARTPAKLEDSGFFITFDENGRIACYVAGDIQFDLNVTGETVAKTAKMPPKGSGTKITFHPTGYPATYKTIVKGNLFGRQMEWNDKGEVISDVDLDIPTAQKQPAQKEKPVMRTWTSRGGKHTLQAQYISADENQVVLETEKGEVVVKLSELSDEDRDYVKKQRE